ncbi:SCO6745 family protein [Dactylosporangium sp. CA-139114]|uniref:SCO6745 family protein n=1 Tax=Dactylosporangium sp. CA-139114 TaxID=3239931 RepID=UPI003D97CE2F
MTTELSTERRLWALYEPLHAVTYFAPAGRAAFEEAGLRGFWRGYFAGRSAPLGPIGPAPVVAAFYGFAPSMVQRALPELWTRITPEAALAARLDGARRALEPAVAGLDGIEEAAELLREAATATGTHGRVLAAANAALPWPGDALGTVWQAATILREHRGDGHLAALLVEGLDGAEAMVWRVALNDGRGRTAAQAARGWSDEEWDAARTRLHQRGYLDGEGVATPKSHSAYDTLEETTDQLAARPWQALGPERTERLATLLTPVAERINAGLAPFYPNWIRLPMPARGAA